MKEPKSAAAVNRHWWIGCLLLTAFFYIYGCKGGKVKQVEDTEYLSYVSYIKIYTDYGTVPPDSTKEALKRHLQKYPKDSRASAFLARLLYEMNELDSSLTAYRKALLYDSSIAKTACSGLGAIYLLKGNNDSAGYYLTKAIKLGDSSAYTYLNLSFLNMHRGKREASFAFADSALAKIDSLPGVAAGISLVYYRQQAVEKSQDMYRIAVSWGLKDTTMFKEVLRGNVKIEDYYRANHY